MKLNVVETGADEIQLKLEGELNIYAVPEAKAAFLEQLRTGKSLVLDLAEVTEMDTAGFQLLMLFKRECAQTGKRFSLVNHSPAVLRLFDLYGAVGYFGDKITVSESERSAYAFAYGMKRQKVLAG